MHSKGLGCAVESRLGFKAHYRLLTLALKVQMNATSLVRKYRTVLICQKCKKVTLVRCPSLLQEGISD